MQSCSIGIVGATGAVGKVFLNLMEARSFPAHSVRLFASPKSEGKQIVFGDQILSVEKITPECFENIDIVFISAGGNISLELAPVAQKAGCVVIDDSSIFRMDPTVPLVVPEVNISAMESHRGIIAIPNCSTTPLVMILDALRSETRITRVIADTYQSVSGIGRAGIETLRSQAMQSLLPPSSQAGSVAETVNDLLAFNVIPRIDSFIENGYTKEEWKMRNETRKILNIPDLPISATCVRVPVEITHSEAVHVDMEKPVTPTRARELFNQYPGVTVIDDPENNEYPMPITATGKDDVLVGRIRKDASNQNGLAVWIASDNLRKGAALNAIQLAEELLQRNWLR
jgi:aspartate-semialdehyde dehydrogenase